MIWLDLNMSTSSSLGVYDARNHALQGNHREFQMIVREASVKSETTTGKTQAGSRQPVVKIYTEAGVNNSCCYRCVRWDWTRLACLNGVAAMHFLLSTVVKRVLKFKYGWCNAPLVAINQGVASRPLRSWPKPIRVYPHGLLRLP